MSDELNEQDELNAQGSQHECSSEVSSKETAAVQEIYDDSSSNMQLLTQIKQYADEIKCADFHGKGTIDDYKALFQAAGKITDDIKRIEMDIDIDGFREFGQAADNLSALFESFTVKLQNLTIVDDTAFLTAIADSLAKIVNLSNVFGRFKQTISATTRIQIPRSVQDAAAAVNSVMDEVSCAMGYISYFVDPSTTGKLPNAELVESDKKSIKAAVDYINSWQDTCAAEIEEAMENNEDIVMLKHANTDLKLKAATLKKLTATLKGTLIRRLPPTL